jgi:two-component system, NtrC family, sensor histidine kinase GlrK
MRLTIFLRLFIGYLLIFSLLIVVSLYVTTKLQELEDVTTSILNINNRTLIYDKKLIDALLSQVQSERKFIILKDNDLYDSFIASDADFARYFKEMTSSEDSSDVKGLFNNIKQSHQRYQVLFHEEVESLRSGQRYSQDWYKQEKEKAINAIMDELKELRNYSENKTYEKIKRLGEIGTNTRKIAVVMTALSLAIGITISIFITRSITKPLTVMRNKTREIAKGNYRSDLNISSPPEISELVQDFNFMCNKLKEIDRMKSDFFSLMSHELRTPLSSIKEGTTLLLDGIGGEANVRQKRILRIISEESNRLIDQVNSILDLSKMDAGMMTYKFIKADIAPLINKVLVEIEPLAKTRDIKTELSISRELPLIKIDTERMLQVLRNLIGNAVKFMPEGGQIKISATVENGNLKVSVTDTGPGIPNANLSTIFDKFKSSAILKGTGLGLVIVKNIVKAHGGKVWAESKQGEGSTFTFMLPA